MHRLNSSLRMILMCNKSDSNCLKIMPSIVSNDKCIAALLHATDLSAMRKFRKYVIKRVAWLKTYCAASPKSFSCLLRHRDPVLVPVVESWCTEMLSSATLNIFASARAVSLLLSAAEASASTGTAAAAGSPSASCASPCNPRQNRGSRCCSSR